MLPPARSPAGVSLRHLRPGPSRPAARATPKTSEQRRNICQPPTINRRENTAKARGEGRPTRVADQLRRATRGAEPRPERRLLWRSCGVSLLAARRTSAMAPATRSASERLAAAPQTSSPSPPADEMELIRSSSRVFIWQWDDRHISQEECIVSEDKLSVCFHPQCSIGAAACRGSTPLIPNGNYYYWEVAVVEAHGTSVMFGLCTGDQRLRKNEYCNLIGLDSNGWSLSHNGLVWHDGKHSKYTDYFPRHHTVTVGMLYDTMRGELSYYMNGKNLGVAFSGLNNLQEPLFPCIGSTAKGTNMHLIGSYCGFVSLLERSCFAILKYTPNKTELVEFARKNRLPKHLTDYLEQTAESYSSQNAIETS